MRSAAAIAASSAGAWLICLALGGALIGSAGPTYDEPVHLASGYAGLRRGRTLNWRDHPPFAELWDALPLLAFRPPPATLLDGSRVWRGVYDHADAFLYDNGAPAERLLNAPRRWSLASWSALLIPAVASWAFALEGAVAAAGAALLLASCPAWFSNAALVTTDAASAALFFLPFWLLARPERTRARWALAGAACGLALASKFNMIALPAIVGAVLAAEARLARPRPRLGFGPGLAAAAALAALALVYRGELGRYVAGLSETMGRLGQGRSAFLAGRHSTTGWLWYFPLALLVKTPLAFLVLAGAGAAAWGRRPSAAGLWLVAPVAAYLSAACFSRTQIGYRHALPVYPFLAVLGGCAAARWARQRRGRWALAALGAWLCASVAWQRPYYLAYFNELAGGPSRGWRWLADSNLDWGQDLKALGAELARRGEPAIYLSYFGVGDPSAYGIRYFPVAPITSVARHDGVAEPPADGPVLLAVSVTNLDGVYYADHDLFAWLRGRAPTAAPGHSIFLYDLTSDEDGRRRLAGLLDLLQYKDQARRVSRR